MFYVCDRLGFVSEIYEDTNYYGVAVRKVRHSIDVRDALPFKTRARAEEIYMSTYKADHWWHCVLHAGRQAG